MPCCVRRAALLAAGLPDSATYKYGDPATYAATDLADLRAIARARIQVEDQSLDRWIGNAIERGGASVAVTSTCSLQFYALDPSRPASGDCPVCSTRSTRRSRRSTTASRQARTNPCGPRSPVGRAEIHGPRHEPQRQRGMRHLSGLWNEYERTDREGERRRVKAGPTPPRGGHASRARNGTSASTSSPGASSATWCPESMPRPSTRVAHPCQMLRGSP